MITDSQVQPRFNHYTFFCKSRCTSYHRGSLGIHKSRCTSITTVLSVSTNPDALAITTVSCRCTSYVPVPLLVTMPSAGSSMGPPAVAVPQIKYAVRPGEGRLLEYASSLRLVSMSARFQGEPKGTTTTARLLLLLEVATSSGSRSIGPTPAAESTGFSTSLSPTGSAPSGAPLGKPART